MTDKEDIDKLEELLKEFEIYGDLDGIQDIRLYMKAIENMLNRNKELEEKWDKDTHKLQNALDLANADKINNYIPVSLVEEKIEELKEEIEQLRIERNVTYDSGIYRNQIKIDILQELLEKR